MQEHTTGVVLINTGTPDSPDEDAIARYLDEFLMDPAIIGAPWPIRRMIVNKIVATRPQKTVGKYRAFWTEEGSPFLSMCRRQAALVQEALQGDGVRVAVAMRYGNPSIKSALESLREAGCHRLVVLPCYPQYANVCAGTCFTAVDKALSSMGWSPEVVRVSDFYEHPLYRQALADSVSRHWASEPGSKLVVSCHSTLVKDIEKGDPYRDQVERTAANLAADLGLHEDGIRVSYHGLFDDRKWLHPLTDDLVKELAENGTSVAVVCPIFTSDNLETVSDVNIDIRRHYEQLAPEGCSFTYIPCLNDDPAFIECLAAVILDALR